MDVHEFAADSDSDQDEDDSSNGEISPNNVPNSPPVKHLRLPQVLLDYGAQMQQEGSPVGGDKGIAA